jgi:hypothetical protein
LRAANEESAGEDGGGGGAVTGVWAAGIGVGAEGGNALGFDTALGLGLAAALAFGAGLGWAVAGRAAGAEFASGATPVASASALVESRRRACEAALRIDPRPRCLLWASSSLWRRVSARALTAACTAALAAASAWLAASNALEVGSSVPEFRRFSVISVSSRWP